MRRFSFVLIFLIFFIGCSTKGINIYIPYKNYKPSDIKVVDKRKNSQIVGYIYLKNKKVADITISSDLTKIIKAELSKRGVSKNIEVDIQKFFMTYDKSKLTKENSYATFVLFLKTPKSKKIIKIEESKWINPLNSSKELEKFSKKIIFEAIDLIVKSLKR